jgi:hypothetical protein
VTDAPLAVFIGPTAHGQQEYLRGLQTRGVTLLPPVKRGDLPSMGTSFARIVLVDGLFNSVPAVGHVEIREALEAGIKLYGCSSMGAIRAYEMRHYGIVGGGAVYEMFFQHEDFTDDELAQLHGAAPHFEPVSEPLVNLRVFAAQLVASGLISAAASRRILDPLQQLYFGQRTLRLFERALAKELPPERTLESVMAGYPARRVKLTDFVSLMEQVLEHRI